MRRVYDIDGVPQARGPELALQWTAIVPAAGNGTRLGTRGPKILYPVLGRPILHWIIDLLEPICSRLVFVVSPEATSPLRAALSAEMRGRTRILVQDHPSGTAPAVTLCREVVRTPYTLVLWGDQITPRPRTVAACMTLLEANASANAAIPAVLRDRPYVHLVRDSSRRIIRVLQTRESEQIPERGENDCGLFLFRTSALFRVLQGSLESPPQGKTTREHNLLAHLPDFDDGAGSLITVRVYDPIETVGINTAQDAESVARALRRRTKQAVQTGLGRHVQRRNWNGLDY